MPEIRVHWWVDRLGNTYQHLDNKPEGYGVSHFWYCYKCGERYAEAKIEGRVWRAIGGVCCNCRGDRWNIPGTLESLFTVGWDIPEVLVRYQLDRELAFLDSPQHPYNEKELV